MKKVLLTAVFALGTLTAIQAQEKEVEAQVETNEEVTVEGDAQLIAKADINVQAFQEIDVTELPEAVTAAVATDFKGATVQKAFVNEKNEFKLVLQTAVEEGKASSKTVFVTNEGVWIKKAKAKMKY